MTDYAELIKRLDHRASTMNGAEPVGSGDGHTYVTGYYTVSDRMLDREAATALEAQAAELAETASALWRIPPNMHTIPCEANGFAEPDPFEGVGETYADAYTREKSRAERAEAALAEARKVLDALDRMNRGVDWCDQDEQARRWSAARRALERGE